MFVNKYLKLIIYLLTHVMIIRKLQLNEFHIVRF